MNVKQEQQSGNGHNRSQGMLVYFPRIVLAILAALLLLLLVWSLIGNDEKASPSEQALNDKLQSTSIKIEDSL